MNKTIQKTIITILAFTMFFSLSAWGKEMEYNLVSLSETASREVPNEIMFVTMQASHRAGSPSASANEVNKRMQWAISIVKKHDELKYETGQYNTYPMYRKERIGEWNSSQQLSIESKDVTLLSKVVGELQEQLQMQNMSFKPSKETQEKIEDELVVEAIKKFQSRAKLIQKAMKGKDYQVVNMDVNTQGGHSPIAYRAQAYEMSSAKMAAPAVEQGSSELSVSVNGQVQIQ